MAGMVAKVFEHPFDLGMSSPSEPYRTPLYFPLYPTVTPLYPTVPRAAMAMRDGGRTDTDILLISYSSEGPITVPANGSASIV